MSEGDKSLAIFGASDGLTSTVAVLIAQIIAGSRHSLIAGGIAIALAASIGMGWSEWLGDSTGSARAAGVMAASTLLASLLPVLPFIVLWKSAGVAAAAALTLILAVAIALLRGSLTPDSYARAASITVGGIILVSAIVSIPSLIIG